MSRIGSTAGLIEKGLQVVDGPAGEKSGSSDRRRPAKNDEQIQVVRQLFDDHIDLVVARNVGVKRPCAPSVLSRLNLPDKRTRFGARQANQKLADRHVETHSIWDVFFGTKSGGRWYLRGSKDRHDCLTLLIAQHRPDRFGHVVADDLDYIL